MLFGSLEQGACLCLGPPWLYLHVAVVEMNPVESFSLAPSFSSDHTPLVLFPEPKYNPAFDGCGRQELPFYHLPFPLEVRGGLGHA